MSYLKVALLLFCCALLRAVAVPVTGKHSNQRLTKVNMRASSVSLGEEGSGAHGGYKLSPDMDITGAETAMKKAKVLVVKVKQMLKARSDTNEKLNLVMSSLKNAGTMEADLKEKLAENGQVLGEWTPMIEDLAAQGVKLREDAIKVVSDFTDANKVALQEDLGGWEEKRDAVVKKREGLLAVEGPFNAMMTEFRKQQQSDFHAIKSLQQVMFMGRERSFEAMKLLFESDTMLAKWALGVGLVTQEEYDQYVNRGPKEPPRWNATPEDPKFFMVDETPRRVGSIRCSNQKTPGTKFAEGESIIAPKNVIDIPMEDSIAYRTEKSIADEHVICYSVKELNHDWKANPGMFGKDPYSSVEFNKLFMSQFLSLEKELGIESARPSDNEDPCISADQVADPVVEGPHAPPKKEVEACIKQHPTKRPREIVELFKAGECGTEKETEEKIAATVPDALVDPVAKLKKEGVDPKVAAKCIEKGVSAKKTAELIKQGKNCDAVVPAPIPGGDSATSGNGSRNRRKKLNSITGHGDVGEAAGGAGGPDRASESGENGDGAKLNAGDETGAVAVPMGPLGSDNGDYVSGSVATEKDVAANPNTHLVADASMCEGGRHHSGKFMMWPDIPQERLVFNKVEGITECYDVVELKDCFEGATDEQKGACGETANPFFPGKCFDRDFMASYHEQLRKSSNMWRESCITAMFKTLNMNSDLEKQIADGKSLMTCVENLKAMVKEKISAVVPTATKAQMHLFQTRIEDQETQLQRLARADNPNSVKLERFQTCPCYSAVTSVETCTQDTKDTIKEMDIALTLSNLENDDVTTPMYNPLLAWHRTEGDKETECFHIMQLVKEYAHGTVPWGRNPSNPEEWFTPTFLNVMDEKFDYHVNMLVHSCDEAIRTDHAMNSCWKK